MSTISLVLRISIKGSSGRRTCRAVFASLWSAPGLWQGIASRGCCDSAGRQVGRSPDRTADGARRRRHGAGQPDDPVAHGIRGHDDPRGRQSSDFLRRQAAAADADARRPRAFAAIAAPATSSSPPRSSSCTRRRCCMTTSSTRATCGAASSAARMLWGNEASVLVGDFLLGQAFKMMVEVGSLACLDVLSTAAAVIAEGEVMQLSAAKDTETTEDDYLAVIRAKTAALFAAACEVGPILAGRGQGRDRRLPRLWRQSRHRFPADRRRARLRRHSGQARQERRRRFSRGQDHAAGRAVVPARLAERARVLAAHAGEGRDRRWRSRGRARDHEQAPRARGHDRARPPLRRDGASTRSGFSPPRPGNMRSSTPSSLQSAARIEPPRGQACGLSGQSLRLPFKVGQSSSSSRKPILRLPCLGAPSADHN